MFDYKKRLRYLRSELNAISLGAFLITNETNVAYLSGFTGDDSFILITPDSQFFLTDSRYMEEAKDTVKGFTIIEVASSTYDTIGNILKNNRVKRIGFESMNLPFEAAKRLEGYVGGARLAPLTNIVEKLRAIKDKKEIGRIKKSVRLTEETLKTDINAIRPGASEKFLSGQIECEFIKKGAIAGFRAIVACQKNSSKPHARPGDTKVARNDFVMVDIGCKFNNYNSDMTRMVLIGKIKDDIKEIYNIVRTAQKKALASVRPGTRISDIDIAGRSYIDKKGYGKFFGHSIGHGVGMDVHEEPSVSRRNNDILKPGMVFTIEPAIYIPKSGWVRIEDIILVTEKGCEVLTK